MPVSAKWANADQTMVLFDFVGGWRWDEFYKLFVETKTWAEAVEHPVVYAYNFLQAGAPPIGIIDQGKKAFYQMASNASHEVIIIGANLLLEKMVAVFLSVFGNRMGVKAHFAGSIAEAEGYISKILKPTR